MRVCGCGCGGQRGRVNICELLNEAEQLGSAWLALGLDHGIRRRDGDDALQRVCGHGVVVGHAHRQHKLLPRQRTPFHGDGDLCDGVAVLVLELSGLGNELRQAGGRVHNKAVVATEARVHIDDGGVVLSIDVDGCKGGLARHAAQNGLQGHDALPTGGVDAAVEVAHRGERGEEECLVAAGLGRVCEPQHGKDGVCVWRAVDGHGEPGVHAVKLQLLVGAIKHVGDADAHLAQQRAVWRVEGKGVCVNKGHGVDGPGHKRGGVLRAALRNHEVGRVVRSVDNHRSRRNGGAKGTAARAGALRGVDARGAGPFLLASHVPRTYLDGGAV